MERIVLRCLQPDPRQRPASAIAVAAALPGGDQLAAALAAGETPSPDLVAAAGEGEGLPVRLAVAILAVSLALIAGIGVWGAAVDITSRVPIDAPPEALARDTRAMLRSFGYTARPADRGFGYTYKSEYLAWLRSHSREAQTRWQAPAAGLPPLIVLLFAARIVLRKPSLAIAAVILLMTALTGSKAEPWVAYPESFLVAIVTTILLLRFGLMAFIAAQAMAEFLVDMPRTFDGSQWHFGLGLAPLAIVAAVALFGFRTHWAAKRCGRAISPEAGRIHPPTSGPCRFSPLIFCYLPLAQQLLPEWYGLRDYRLLHQRRIVRSSLPGGLHSSQAG